MKEEDQPFMTVSIKADKETQDRGTESPIIKQDVFVEGIRIED